MVRQLNKGQLLLRKARIIGKPEKLYINDDNPNTNYLVKLSTAWPPEYGEQHFIHRAKLMKFYETAAVGIQLKLF